MASGWEDWAVADSDASHPIDLKAWLCGIPLLHDPAAVVVHRFRSRFHNFVVPPAHIAVNAFRTARKHRAIRTGSSGSNKPVCGMRGGRAR